MYHLLNNFMDYNHDNIIYNFNIRFILYNNILFYIKIFIYLKYIKNLVFEI